jgi:hypothetical protein
VKEQRTKERFNLCCLVTFREGPGWSRDISTTGIYFSTKKVLKVSEMIQFTIRLNHEPNIQCDGKVVRTEQRTDGYGVAIQFTELFIIV